MCTPPPEMPWIAELREIARVEAAERARAAAQAKAVEAVAAIEEAKHRQHPEELRSPSKHQTFEEVEEERRRNEEAFRRSQLGMFGKIKDLVSGKPG
jgi:hypothetical protein